MLILLKKLIGGKILSFPIMIGGVIAIVLLIVFMTNTDTILSNLGFETKTTLASKLAESESNVDRTTDINEELNETIRKLEARNKLEDKTLDEVETKEEIATEKVDNIKKKNTEIASATVRKINPKIVIKEKEDTITLPLKETNKLAKENMDSLNEVFDTLFHDCEE